jgi:hypothetical protein
MPIFTEDELLRSTTVNPEGVVSDTQATAKAGEPSSFIDTLTASFKLDNSVFNVVKETIDIDADTSGSNENFDPFLNNGEKLRGYEFQADAFIGANSDKV